MMAMINWVEKLTRWLVIGLPVVSPNLQASSASKIAHLRQRRMTQLLYEMLISLQARFWLR